ncbi:MAG: pyridoxamine 5'-phosphate oxidase family protein [Pseudonocardiales bacterium]|nr:pyridoxamine 5'-phosphate oxidase family protein [Pseudonocardiales bacterium]
MARWSEITAAEPEFARQVRARFAVYRCETLATLRRDGSPRISGIDAVFSDGDLWLPMMVGSVKIADLRRDPRLALHSPTTTALNADLSDWPGEAKIAGYVVEGTEANSNSERLIDFRVDVTEVVLTYLDRTDFVVESWHEGRGLRRRERWYPDEHRVEHTIHWEQKNDV